VFFVLDVVQVATKNVEATCTKRTTTKSKQQTMPDHVTSDTYNDNGGSGGVSGLVDSGDVRHVDSGGGGKQRLGGGSVGGRSGGDVDVSVSTFRTSTAHGQLSVDEVQ